MHPPQHTPLGPATSVEHYLSLVLNKRPEGSESGWMFRGQRDAGRVPVPKIDRAEYVAYRVARGWTRQKHEERLLSDFQRGARPHVRVEPRGAWEWLAVAQHHGLATRLLDWTANPMAALYFAVEREHDRSCSGVWCYHHEGDAWTPGRRASPFKVKNVTEFRPAHLTPRITVQGGCFTAHPDPIGPVASHWPGDLRLIEIPSELRPGLRDSLRKLGVDRATLFPDLDGIAYSLNCRFCGQPALTAQQAVAPEAAEADAPRPRVNSSR